MHSNRTSRPLALLAFLNNINGDFAHYYYNDAFLIFKIFVLGVLSKAKAYFIKNAETFNIFYFVTTNRQSC